MTKCHEIHELISGYMDDMLEEAESERVSAHLESCSECRGLHQDLLAMTAQLTELEALELPQGFHDRLMGRLRAETPSPKQQILWKRLAWGAAAAAVLLFSFRFLGEGDLLRQEEPSQNEDRKIAADPEFRAAEDPDAFTGEEPGIAALPEAARSEEALIYRVGLDIQDGNITLGDIQFMAHDLGIETTEAAEQSILLYISDPLSGAALYEQLEVWGTLDPLPGVFEGEFQPFYLFIILR